MQKAVQHKMLEEILKAEGLSLAEYTKLPHPRRLEIAKVLGVFEQHPVFGKLLKELAKPHVTPDNVMPPRTAGASSATHGLQHSILVPLKHLLSRGRTFHIRESLFDRLILTDIDDSLPCRSLRLPFPACYFQLERPRTDFSVPNSETGEHPWEGVYLLEYERSTYLGFNEDGTDSEREGRVILIMFIGRTKDGDPDNDATWSIPLFMSEEAKLSEELARLIQSRTYRAARMGEPPYSPRDIELMHQMVQQTARVMLYLSCAQARTELVPARTELLKKVERAGPGKKSKLLRQAARTYDFIQVGPERFLTPLPHQSGGRSVIAHLRRGHFRNQRYGEKLGMSKLMWIEATMVNAEKPDEGAKLKDYRVH
jgi:hypothetical protein